MFWSLFDVYEAQGDIAGQMLMDAMETVVDSSKMMIRLVARMPVGLRFDLATPWLEQALGSCLINSFSWSLSELPSEPTLAQRYNFT